MPERGLGGQWQMRALPPSGGYPIAPAASAAYPTPQQASSSSSSSQMPTSWPTPPQREQTLFEIDGKNIYQYGPKKTISQMNKLEAVAMYNMMAYTVGRDQIHENTQMPIDEIRRFTRKLYKEQKFKLIHVEVK